MVNKGSKVGGSTNPAGCPGAAGMGLDMDSTKTKESRQCQIRPPPLVAVQSCCQSQVEHLHAVQANTSGLYYKSHYKCKLPC